MNEEIGRMIKLFLLWWALLLVPIIIGTVVSLIVPNRPDYDIMGWSMMFGSLLIAIVFFGKCYVKLTLGNIDKRQVWPAACISVAIAAAFLLALMSFYKLIDFDSLIPTDTELMAERARQHYQGIAGILYGCIVGPLVEEIGFRGVLLGGLLKTRCRPWLAILISAFLFGLIHGPVGFIGAMPFGIMLGWLYWRTSTIIPGIIIHIVNNTLSFIDLSEQSNAVCLFVLVGSLTMLASGLLWFGRKVKKIQKHETTS